VNSTHWLPEQADGKLPEVKQTFLVEVPPYVDGKPGELWVLRQADGSVKVVSSDYQPDHEKWPGEVKGWPVPSIEYRRERWALHLKLAESDVENVKSLIEELRIKPEVHMAEVWEFRKKYNPSDLAGFSGPEDPKFNDWLKKKYENSLRRSEANVRRMKEIRP
jgi:hypothetical protein